MINPISKYFDWHDSKYLSRALKPEKNQFDIKMFSILRVVSFLSFLGSYTALIFSFVWPAVIDIGSKIFLAFSVGFLMLFYTWVTEALLFRKYIETYRDNDK